MFFALQGFKNGVVAANTESEQFFVSYNAPGTHA